MSEPRILKDDPNRDQYPLFDGLFAYFPAALCEVARWSIVGNNKHNPGERLHWCREKSQDHENKIMRHLLDARQVDKDGFVEAVALAWRALALLQTILEERGWPEGKNGKWAKKEEKTNAGNSTGAVNLLCANIRAVGEAHKWAGWFVEQLIERVRTFDFASGDKWPDCGKPSRLVAGFQAIQEADTAQRGSFEDREIDAAHGGVTGRGIAGSKVVDLAPSSTVRVGK